MLELRRLKHQSFSREPRMGNSCATETWMCMLLGWPFLALIQGTGTKKQLIPRIKTPQDDSELHAFSNGQIIAERIKYKVKELNIVKTENVSSTSGYKCHVHSCETTVEVKSLIKKMITKPEDHMSASKVLNFLHSLEPRHWC